MLRTALKAVLMVVLISATLYFVLPNLDVPRDAAWYLRLTIAASLAVFLGALPWVNWGIFFDDDDDEEDDDGASPVFSWDDDDDDDDEDEHEKQQALSSQLEAARRYIEAIPFQPFIINLSDGRKFEIHEPELVALGSKRIIITSDDYTCAFIDPLLIVSMDVLAGELPPAAEQQVPG